MKLKVNGTALIFTAALLYSTAGLVMKFVPWNGLAVNGSRTIIALLVVGLYMTATHQPIRINRWIFLGSLCYASCTTLFALANKLTTAANTIVLQFTAPVLVILFSALFFRRKVTKLDLAACALVFGGVSFFFLDSLEMGGGLGNILALLSGVSYAGVFLMNDFPESSAISSVFWGDMISAVVGLPFLMQETEFTVSILASLLFLGVFQVGVSYVCLCEGLKTTPPIRASLITGIEPILNPILVAVFYGETVGPMALLGAAVVVVAVIAYNILKLQEKIPIKEKV